MAEMTRAETIERDLRTGMVSALALIEELEQRAGKAERERALLRDECRSLDRGRATYMKLAADLEGDLAQERERASSHGNRARALDSDLRSAQRALGKLRARAQEVEAAAVGVASSAMPVSVWRAIGRLISALEATPQS
jgi:chromosome segregation ATPase